MRTAKTTLQIMLAVAVIAITVPAGLYLLGNLYFTTERTIEINWDIDLPKGIREEYNVHTPTSFHGDGERYTVFQWDGGDKTFLSHLTEQKSVQAEQDITDILSYLEVDEAYLPDYTHAYRWNSRTAEDNSTLYLFYDTDLQRLCVIQRLL